VTEKAPADEVTILDQATQMTTMSSSSGTPESWISSFCSLLGHEYFAEVSEEFIEDDFNLTGLQTQVAMYKEALEVRRLCITLLFCFLLAAQIPLCFGTSLLRPSSLLALTLSPDDS
jgi:hypothetical protein